MRVSSQSLLVLAGVLLTVATAIVAGIWAARRRKDQELRDHGAPLLVVPSFQQLPGGATAAAPRRPSPLRNVVQHGAIDVTADLTAISPNSATPPSSAPIRGRISDPLTATTGRFEAGGPRAEVVAGHTLRFHRPADGTVEFLPGCLEVVGGPDAGHEVRFVRPENGAKPVITFGRQDGPAYSHIQLLEPTVSRAHARMVLDGDQWRMVNLSRTNPVVLNREGLDGFESSLPLSDGDVIEMGALVFRFHAK